MKIRIPSTYEDQGKSSIETTPALRSAGYCLTLIADGVQQSAVFRPDDLRGLVAQISQELWCYYE